MRRIDARPLAVGRPRGPLRELLFTALEQPATAREIAQRTQIAFKTTTWMLHNMVVGGDAVKLRCVRVEGVHRPVPVYGRNEPACAAASDPAQLALQRQWSTWWPSAETLAARPDHSTEEATDGAD